MYSIFCNNPPLISSRAGAVIWKNANIVSCRTAPTSLVGERVAAGANDKHSFARLITQKAHAIRFDRVPTALPDAAQILAWDKHGRCRADRNPDAEFEPGVVLFLFTYHGAAN